MTRPPNPELRVLTSVLNQVKFRSKFISSFLINLMMIDGLVSPLCPFVRGEIYYLSLTSYNQLSTTTIVLLTISSLRCQLNIHIQ